MPFVEAKEALTSQIRETRLIMVSRLFYTDYSSHGSPNSQTQTIKDLLYSVLYSQNTEPWGRISPDTQRIFANGMRTGVQRAIVMPANRDLGDAIAEIWNIWAVEWERLKITDVAGAFILVEAVHLYVWYLGTCVPQRDYTGAKYQAEDLRQRCSTIIDADAAKNIHILSELPEFNLARDSPRDMTETDPATHSFLAPLNSNGLNANYLFQNFLRPAFP